MSTRGAHLVARVGSSTFVKLSVDPRQTVAVEVACLGAVQHLAVPQLRRVDRRARGEPRWFAMDQVPGRPSSRWSFLEVAAVGRALASLHRARVPSSLRPLPGGSRGDIALAGGQRSVEVLQGAQVLTPTHAASVLAILSCAGADLALVAGRARAYPLCHGDVCAANVFFAGPDQAPEAFLLDFEHAGRGDPAIDLARVFGYERLSRHAWFVLCHAYLEAGGREETVDRAVLLAPPLSLVLALGAARFAVDVLTGRVTCASRPALERRLAAVARRVEDVVVELGGRPIRLNLSRVRPRPALEGGA